MWRLRLREARNLPNTLTLLRLAATPGLAYLIFVDRLEAAIVGCFCAGVLDWVDGVVARRWNMKTVLGSFLDPLADKVFIGSILAALTVKGHLPAALTALIVGRDVALLGGSFWYRYKTKPAHVPFFATEGDGTMEVEPTAISRANTVLQMVMLGCCMTHPAWGWPDATSLSVLQGTVAVTTVLSGASYLSLDALKLRGKRASSERRPGPGPS